MSKARAASGVGDTGQRAERMFRLADLPELTGYAEDYHWALIRQKRFPEPIRLGARAIAWPESVIRQWQQERITAGYKANMK